MPVPVQDEVRSTSEAGQVEQRQTWKLPMKQIAEPTVHLGVVEEMGPQSKNQSNKSISTFPLVFLILALLLPQVSYKHPR